VLPTLLTVPVGRRSISVELYHPSTPGPHPGVLLLHELFGLTSNVRADARELAREGYLVLAPDLYSGGMGRYCMRFFFSRQALANKSDAEPVAEIHHLLDHLKADPGCNGMIGMIGMCLTGGFVLHMAKRDDLAAPVVYHHGFGVGGSGISDRDAAEIQTTIQGHFLAEDRICPRSKIEALAAQLGDRLEVNLYPAAGHGLRSALRHTAHSDEAWSRTLAFLREQLAS